MPFVVIISGHEFAAISGSEVFFILLGFLSPLTAHVESSVEQLFDRDAVLMLMEEEPHDYR